MRIVNNEYYAGLRVGRSCPWRGILWRKWSLSAWAWSRRQVHLGRIIINY